MRHDRLRTLLNGGEPSIGIHLLSSWPSLVELIGDAGIALMIEKRERVEDLDAVLSIEGIDMVRFGSSDYPMSLGLTGQRNHPDVVKAERKTIGLALKKRLHPRVELADIKQAAPHQDVKFCIGWHVASR